jgi:hypothetical protein
VTPVILNWWDNINHPMEMKMTKKLTLFILLALSQSVAAWAQGAKVVPEGRDFVIESTQPKDRVDLTPDLVEVLVELDPKAHGYRARNHVFALGLDYDPLINGRLTLGFQVKLTDHLTLDVPVSFEHSAITTRLGVLLGTYDERINSRWSIAGGVGLKIRLSEWMMKSSFYLEPMVQAGYYAESAQGFASTSAVRIRPAIYLGWERIFDSGFVIGAKLGFEKPFDVALGAASFYTTGFSLVPMLGLGYAW